MNVQIGTEAAQFPEKEYKNGIFLAVCNPERNRGRKRLNGYVVIKYMSKYQLGKCGGGEKWEGVLFLPSPTPIQSRLTVRYVMTNDDVAVYSHHQLFPS
jgi:hypothetical protein